jgi:hypothetical protein
MKPFFIKFNVLYLGSLFFALVFLGALSHSARPPFGDSFFLDYKILRWNGDFCRLPISTLSSSIKLVFLIMEDLETYNGRQCNQQN